MLYSLTTLTFIPPKTHTHTHTHTHTCAHACACSRSFRFLKVFYSLTTLPFLFFKLPVLGQLLTHVRATGKAKPARRAYASRAWHGLAWLGLQQPLKARGCTTLCASSPPPHTHTRPYTHRKQKILTAGMHMSMLRYAHCACAVVLPGYNSKGVCVALIDPQL